MDVPHTIVDLLGVEPFTIRHGQSLRPYLEGRRPAKPRDHIFSEYLENEEACVRTEQWNARTPGYITDNPTPGRYIRLYDEKKDPDESTDLASKHPEVVARLSGLMLARFRATHPDASSEPKHSSVADSIDWYLRPRDATPRPATAAG